MAQHEEEIGCVMKTELRLQKLVSGKEHLLLLKQPPTATMRVTWQRRRVSGWGL
jgi:hypothetical protein